MRGGNGRQGRHRSAPQGAADTSLSPPHLAAGDAIRGLAALAVVVFHAQAMATGVRTEPTSLPLDLHRLIFTLDTGVYVFLALSGYLIARPFLYALLLDHAMPDWRPYLLRRFARLAPALWLFAGLTLVVHGTAGSSLREVLAVFGFAQVYDPSAFGQRIVQAWTVDVELAFYVAVPVAAWALLRLMRRLRSARARLAALVALLAPAAAGSLALRLEVGVGSELTFIPVLLVYAFVPGIVLAGLEPLVAARARGRAWPRRAALASAGVVVGAIAWMATLDTYAPRLWLATLVGGGVVATAVLWQWSTGAAVPGLRSRAANWIGERAYSLYLCHVLVGSQLHDLARAFDAAVPAVAAVTLAMVAISVPLAAVSYRWVERPVMDRARRWRPRAPRLDLGDLDVVAAHPGAAYAAADPTPPPR